MNFQCSVSVTLCMYNVPCADTAQGWMLVCMKDEYWLNPEQTESLTLTITLICDIMDVQNEVSCSYTMYKDIHGATASGYRNISIQLE